MGQQSNLNEILVFMAVADGGSFVAGGQAMGLTGSAASKAVGRLEARLATRLFQRTTRAIRLTEEGRVLYDRGLEVVAALARAESSVGGKQGAPRGILRVTVPDAFGRRILMPVVQSYLQRWPEVRVELSLSDRPADLVQEGFDLAFRLGRRSASKGLIARVITTYPVALCAAPAYLDRHPAPTHPDQLSQHECLLFRSAQVTQSWRFRAPHNQWERMPARGRLRLDSGEALLQAAIAGAGIALLPEFLFGDAMASGLLHAVLPDLDLGQAEIVALYPSKAYLEPRVRHFIDLVSDTLSAARGG